MREKYQKIIAIFLIILITASPISASEKIKFVSKINHEFSLAEMPDTIEIVTSQDISANNELLIPKNSTVTADVMQAQKERRWHKSGYILCKLRNYTKENETVPIDISDKDIYLIGRKYEEINKKDATILGTELVLTQAASIVGSLFIFFAPVDIVYFFTKGAIQREKDPNWFKAGFYNAYDNSIMWFWFKGKPIDLAENDSLQLKSIKEGKALKLTKKIEKRKAKQARKNKST